MTNELVKMFEENRLDDFLKAAEQLSRNFESKEIVKRGLLDQVNAEGDVVDLRLRRIAVDVMCLLGLAQSVDVRRELLRVFRRQFDELRLAELAALEAQSRAYRCRKPNPDMEFLQCLLRALLRVPDEESVGVALNVARIFANTKFGCRLARRISEIGDGNK